MQLVLPIHASNVAVLLDMPEAVYVNGTTSDVAPCAMLLLADCGVSTKLNVRTFTVHESWVLDVVVSVQAALAMTDRLFALPEVGTAVYWHLATLVVADMPSAATAARGQARSRAATGRSPQQAQLVGRAMNMCHALHARARAHSPSVGESQLMNVLAPDSNVDVVSVYGPGVSTPPPPYTS